MRVPILPPPGLVSDHTEFAAPGVWASGSNVRFFHGAPQAVGGEIPLQSGALETYSSVDKLLAYKVSGVVNLAIAGTTFYRANTTTWARTDITPASGWFASDGHSLALFGDVLLAACHSLTGTSNSTLFSSTDGAQAVAVAGAPANINCMLVTPSRQVMALGCNEEISATYNSRCIRWSDIGTIATWTTSSSNNAGEYILPGQEEIVGARVVGDFIVIWTTGTLFLGQYIGQPSQTFVFSRVDGTGLIGRHCHAEYQGTVYWMTPEASVYAWRPGDVPMRVECPCIIDVWDEMGLDSGKPDASQRNRYHAFANRRYGEIWFCYPSQTASNANRYLAYCIKESEATQKQVWFRGSMLAQAVTDDPLLADALNMKDSTIIRIDAAASSALNATDLTGASESYPAWNIRSSYYYADEARRRVQIQRYVADSHGDSAEFSLTLYTRPYPEAVDLELTSGPYTIVTTGVSTTLKKDFRASGRVAAIKFANTANSNLWRHGKAVFEVVPLGNR